MAQSGRQLGWWLVNKFVFLEEGAVVFDTFLRAGLLAAFCFFSLEIGGAAAALLYFVSLLSHDWSLQD